MGRALTGTVKYPNDEPWSGGVITDELLQGFTTSTTVYPATTSTITLQADGTIPNGTEIAVPETGTAYHKFTKPNNTSFRVYLAAGAPLDLVTLETIAGSSVDQDDLQTLLDNNNVFDITTATTTYAIQATDEYVRCDGTFTATLPAATGSGYMVAVKNRGVGTITVAPNGSDTINGGGSVSITPLQGYTFIDAAAGEWDLWG